MPEIKQIPGPLNSGKGGTLSVSYTKVVEVLGEPNCQDDPHKVDVAWAVEEVDGDRKLGVWNYKNGPAWTGKGTTEDICEFSIGGPFWGDKGFKFLAIELFGAENVT